MNEPVSTNNFQITLPPLNSTTLWTIINRTLSDDTVNRLLAYYLGYRFVPEAQTWNVELVPPEWAETYPIPPDFIASRPATVKLTRSIPKADKQLLKDQLGFKGYQVGELTPTLTRRATAVNWLLSYMKQQKIPLDGEC